MYLLYTAVRMTTIILCSYVNIDLDITMSICTRCAEIIDLKLNPRTCADSNYVSMQISWTVLWG